ncbi:hypothetical protein K0504_00230 [Neiella marina]|uniref:MSHA pilin protein MshC n=1 Tax=Neiella holothuriorum TaxID=2870530 RepID=A0ABS7EAU2_9GAMM|nr:hypothetical protein [Neiella holothuriorum]MBW8189445.1 hypothetical protein [Neiella holothuriorum]
MGTTKRILRHAQTGFTTVELVVIIIVLGVIAVTAAPRFVGSQGFEETALRDELLQRLRAVQLSAMNGAESDCHMLVIDANQFGVSEMNSESPVASPPCPGTLEHVSNYSSVTITTGQFEFDRIGRPLNSCNGGCDISVEGSGGDTETIRIETEGFIHAL